MVRGFPPDFDGKSFVIGALLKTGLFRKPERKFSRLFDLKTSGKEAFLFTSYAGGYYFLDDKYFLKPTGEEYAFNIPIVPLSTVTIEEFSRYLAGLGYVFHGSIDGGLKIARRKKFLHDFFARDKYLLIYVKRDYGPVTDRTRRKYASEFVKEIQKKINSFIELGVEPQDIIIYPISEVTEKWEYSIAFPGEDFYGYLAGCFFRRMGYLCSQKNLGGIGPFDDFFAYKPKDLIKGAFLLELCLGFVKVNPTKSVEGETIFMELEDTPAEIGQKHGLPKTISQLENFTQSYIVLPCQETYAKNKEDYGVLTFDSKGKPIFKRSKGRGEWVKEDMLREVNAFISLAVQHSKFVHY